MYTCQSHSALLVVILAAASCVGISGKGASGNHQQPVKLVNVIEPDGVLQPTEDGRRWLRALGTEAMRVVAISGTYQSGKSSLLNQLLGRQAFAVGNGADRKTRGLWAVALNGTIFIDTEGLSVAGVPEMTDAKLFATASLFSSMLVYNSRQLVDARQLEYLDLLTRRASLFALRAAIRNATHSKNWISLPPLLWVMQNIPTNFSAQRNASVWLRDLISKQGGLHNDSFLNSFSAVTAASLPTPTTDLNILLDIGGSPKKNLSKGYVAGLDTISRFIGSAETKLINGVGAGGALLSGVLEILVEAANDGLVPALPSLWTAYEERARAAARSDCHQAYDTVVSEELSKVGSTALTDSEIDRLHDRGVRACLPLMVATDTDVAALLAKRRQNLDAHFGVVQERACSSARDQARRSFIAKGKAMRYPMPSTQLESSAKRELQQAIAAALRDTNGLGCTGMSELLQEDLEGVIASLKVENFKQMTHSLSELEEKALMVIKVPPMIAAAERADAFKTAEELWAREYDSAAVFAKAEDLMPSYRSRARESAIAKVNQLLDASQSAGKKLVDEELKRQESSLYAAIGQLQVPASNATLKEQAGHELQTARAALRTALSRFVKDPAFGDTLDALNATILSALGEKLVENSEVVTARVALFAGSCYTVWALQDYALNVLNASSVSEPASGTLGAELRALRDRVIRIFRSPPGFAQASATREAEQIAIGFAQKRWLLLVSLYMPYIVGTVTALVIGAVLGMHWTKSNNDGPQTPVKRPRPPTSIPPPFPDLPTEPLRTRSTVV